MSVSDEIFMFAATGFFIPFCSERRVWCHAARDIIDALWQDFYHWCEMLVMADSGRVSSLL
jgi:hypothetical protein